MEFRLDTRLSASYALLSCKHDVRFSKEFGPFCHNYDHQRRGLSIVLPKEFRYSFSETIPIFFNVLAMEICMVGINLDKLAQRQNSERYNADFWPVDRLGSS